MLCVAMLLFLQPADAQRRKNQSPASSSVMNEETFEGIKLRNIGPAFMSGRIGDVVIHPENENTWYVGVASGGVWKTVNAGTTWTPVFDEESSYSIGCVAIDPNNPNTVWVGTGENDGGRHIGYGDGIYRSMDGGKSWENMGLPNSEHISKIVIHPNNSDVMFVASQGPLWSKGGDRGFYKSTDGGKTWTKTLGDSEWTGVTDIAMNPDNPNELYAATWQRHRTVAAYMGGGPRSGIHKSTDGGETWTRLTRGLPDGNVGKIGLALSPQNSNVIYAAIEEERRTGGVYKSDDSGMNWNKQSDAVASATGPHYYQELYASPHQEGRLYLIDSRMQVSDDGGKNFYRMKSEFKHGDNHAVAFKPSDPDYLLVGTDGGLYESFDLTENWRFMDNLPVTQFYKVAVDDAEPFYNIYGGTQDNSTQGGPSRTDNVHGIQNSDWRVVLNWDGHQTATEPGNPDIIYAERQEGNLSRIDMSTGEVVDIQPQPGPDEDYERFNWDSPILVSPHKPSRIYFASQRVWKSENRGDEWENISGDLTKDQERITLPIMGKKQSWDAPWDMFAMSNYNTITSLSESPKQEGLLYAGTDDGIIQVTEDGGENWQQIDVGSIPGIPATAFVNDIKADLHDANTVYVSLDNHKYGDYTPYVVMSTDKGQSWKSLRANLPDRTLVWRLVQDHVKPELLFLATEYGIYFSNTRGQQWTKLTGGVPTISFRDLAIQKREDDLVGASFGRGFFVLDDISVLREVSEENLMAEAELYSTRKAWWYVPRSHLSFDNKKGSQGASHYVADNPPFGAVLTYHLRNGLKSMEEERMEKETAMLNKDIPFPGWEQVAAEKTQMEPKIWLTIKDEAGSVVRRMEGPKEKGFHRVAWDLRYPAPNAIKMQAGKEEYEPKGMMAAPGTYTATLSKQEDGTITQLAGPISFEVEPLREGALEGTEPAVAAAFWRDYEDATRSASALQVSIGNAMMKVEKLQESLARSTMEPGEMDAKVHGLRSNLINLEASLLGNPAKRMVGEKIKPTVNDRLFSIQKSIEYATYGPTETNKKTLVIVEDQLNALRTELDKAKSEMNKVSQAIIESGAPWVEGEALPPVGPNRR